MQTPNATTHKDPVALAPTPLRNSVVAEVVVLAVAVALSFSYSLNFCKILGAIPMLQREPHCFVTTAPRPRRRRATHIYTII